MNDETRGSWDEISEGSPLVFIIEASAHVSKGFPFPVLKRHDGPIIVGPVTYGMYPLSAEKFQQGTFAVYLGMTSVKMKRSGSSSHVEGNVVDRAFRTVLIGQNKYLLDDPNMIKIV